MGEHRNLIIAVIVLMVFMLGYQYFVLEPMAEERRQAEIAASGESVTAGDDAPAADPALFGVSATTPMTREEALAASDRIAVRTPALQGSIALDGARFDDLQLLRYDTQPDSGAPVTLLSPEGAPGGHYVAGGWLGQSQDLPGLSARWTLVEGDTLTPETPVTLEYAAGELVFRRTIAVDGDYLFTVTDRISNTGDAPQSLGRFAVVRQEGLPADLSNFFILHEGAVGVVGDQMIDRTYKKLDEQRLVERSGAAGWMGITSKYWLAAAAPGTDAAMRGQFRILDRPGQPVYEANYLADPISIAPGEPPRTCPTSTPARNPSPSSPATRKRSASSA